jgi:hypothetical protein
MIARSSKKPRARHSLSAPTTVHCASEHTLKRTFVPVEACETFHKIPRMLCIALHGLNAKTSVNKLCMLHPQVRLGATFKHPGSGQLLSGQCTTVSTILFFRLPRTHVMHDAACFRYRAVGGTGSYTWTVRHSNEYCSGRTRCG